MIKINPQFVYDEAGNKVGVILSAREFEKCVDVLEDFQDYQLISQRSGKRQKLIPLDQAVNEIMERRRK